MNMVSIFFIALILFILLVLLSSIWAMFRAAPFVPTKKKTIKKAISSLKINEKDIVYDIGSGDGQIVLLLVKMSRAKIIGYEISLLPYLISLFRLKILNPSPRAKILYRDFYKQDLSDADYIFCYLTPKAMAKLKEKFERELKPGAKIISFSFKIKGWKPYKSIKYERNTSPTFFYIVREENKV